MDKITVTQLEKAEREQLAHLKAKYENE